jgi:hypothetical protein
LPGHWRVYTDNKYISSIYTGCQLILVVVKINEELKYLISAGLIPRGLPRIK